MDAAREVADLDERLLGVLMGNANELGSLLGVAPFLQAPASPAEVDGQRDEPRLRAVVEVTLDLPAVARCGGDREVTLRRKPLRRLLELVPGRGRAGRA